MRQLLCHRHSVAGQTVRSVAIGEVWFQRTDKMAADSALSEEIRREIFPNSRLKGSANLLIMPTLDAANIAVNMLKVVGEAQPIGPILLGAAKPVHILTPSVTVRGIVNMSAVATVDAQVAADQPAG